MVTPELTNYINQAKAAGMTEQQIKDELIKAGWQQADINETFADAAAPISDSPISAKMSSLKISVIATIGILLIAGSASAFWYADKKLNWGIISPKKVTENIIPSATPLQESSLQTLPQESNFASPSPSVTPKSKTEDCGTYDATHAFIAPPLTDKDKATLSCFNDAASDCNPSIIKGAGGIYGSSAYEILGKNNNDCEISLKIINPSTAPDTLSIDFFDICVFPMDSFIIPMLEEMKKQKDDTLSIGLIFSLGLSFTKEDAVKIGNDGWYHPSGAKNTKTGEPIIYKCK